MMIALLIGFSSASKAKKCFKTMLADLRDELNKQANEKKLDYNDPKFVLSDTVCCFTGQKHKSYNYNVIQALLADELLLKTLIMNEFKYNQDVLKTFQTIAVKMYGKKEINIEEEMKDLLRALDRHPFYWNKTADCYNFYEFISNGLCPVINVKEGYIYPQAFKLEGEKITHCNYCAFKYDRKRKVWYKEEITYVNENIQEKLTDWIKKNISYNRFCNYCKKDVTINESEVMFPSRFDFKVYQNKMNPKHINGIDKVNHQLKIRENIYELYAVICEYQPFDTKESFFFSLTLKGKDWYMLFEETVLRVDLETGRIFEIDGDVNNESDINREDELDDPMGDSWIYYYRKIQ